MRPRWTISIALGIAAIACRDFEQRTTETAGGAGEQAGQPSGGAPEADAGSGNEAPSGGSGAGEGGAREPASEAGAAAEAAAGAGQTSPRPPFCETGVNGHPVIGLTSSRDLAVARTYSGAPFVLFTSQPTTEIISLSWSVESAWTKWSCFDAVAQPERVGAGNRSDGYLQVYTTSKSGELFVRQQLTGGYLPWLGMPLPAEASRALDVAVVSSPASLYIAAGDDGVFSRRRMEDESQVESANWTQVSDARAERLAVGVRDSGEHDLLIVTSDGSLYEAVQDGAEPLGAFGATSAVKAPWRFVDVDFARNALNQLQTFAVTTAGQLVVRTLGSSWSEWSVVASASAPKLTTLAAGQLTAQPPHLFAIDRYGLPYVSQDAGASWTPRF